MVTDQAPAELDELWRVAGSVCDPELPPLTVADLGILRSVVVEDGTVVATVTPTYSGCPAVEVIEDDIRTALERAGCDRVRIVRSFAPAWTTDWITADGHRKLRDAGIAPPRPVPAGGPVPVTLGARPIACPRCGSADTVEVSAFGSTACKALRRCRACAEPFDHVKEL